MATTRTRSRKAEQAQRSQRLRGEGQTWAEVAAEFRRAYGVNSRVALRIARNWSQAQAADEWNKRWPDDQRTFKNFSYWEQWPASTGYAPSLEVLTRLAELYECRVADLLDDGPDYSARDPMRRARTNSALVSRLVDDSNSHGPDIRVAAELAGRVQEADVQELAQFMSAWSHMMDSAIDRRALLLKLSFALTMAAAAPESDAGNSERQMTVLPSALDLSGVWRSRYVYRSSTRQEEYEDIHFLVLEQDGQQLTARSLPHTTGSAVGMALTVDSHAVTGTWEEQTSPTGYYKGTTYRGALQLLLSPTGGEMKGKWIGFGRNFAINSGDWELTLEDRRTTKAVLREYHLRA